MLLFVLFLLLVYFFLLLVDIEDFSPNGFGNGTLFVWAIVSDSGCGIVGGSFNCAFSVNLFVFIEFVGVVGKKFTIERLVAIICFFVSIFLSGDLGWS